MADKIQLEGAARTQFGKGAARRLRVANLIPATVYAGGEEPAYLQLPAKETTNALRHKNALFELNIEGTTHLAVVKDIQRNPVKRVIEHIDFYAVRAGEVIVAEVPVFVEGEPKGSGVALVDLQKLPVSADVTSIPERIVVNVEGLQTGDKVLAKDVVLPEGCALALEDVEEPVVSVEAPSGEASEAAETEETAEDAE